MRTLLLKYISIIVTIYFLSMFIDIYMSDAMPLLLMGFVLIIVNMTIKPLLLILTLPLSIITLGIFTFIVNAWTIMIADRFVKGFSMGGFWNSLLAALVIGIFHSLIKEADKPHYNHE